MEERSDFQIEGVYSLMNDLVVSGTVKSGTLRVGMKSEIEGKTAVVQGIESFRKMIREAGPETKVGLKLAGADKSAIENRMNGILTFSGPTPGGLQSESLQDLIEKPANKGMIVAVAIGILVLAGIGFAVLRFI